MIELRGQEIDEWTQNYNQLEDSLQNLRRSEQKSFEFEQKNQSLLKELEMANYNLSIKNQQFEALKNVRFLSKANRDYELQIAGQKKQFSEDLQAKN